MPVIKSITINKPIAKVKQLWSTLEDVPQERVIVRFTSIRVGKQTEIRVELMDEESHGLLSTALGKLFGRKGPGDIDRSLRHFKQVVETGEVIHSDASIHQGAHPAQPVKASDPSAPQLMVMQ